MYKYHYWIIYFCSCVIAAEICLPLLPLLTDHIFIVSCCMKLEITNAASRDWIVIRCNMSYIGDRGKYHPMPSHLEQDPGIVVAQYDFVGVKAGDWNIERISLGRYTESDFIELVSLGQHDIVEANLRQRLNGMPAPMSSAGLLWPGTAHVFFNDWEAKYKWDVEYCHNIHESHFGELPQINRSMESDDHEGVSLAQGHQGERTFRDPKVGSRRAEIIPGISFTSAKMMMGSV